MIAYAILSLVSMAAMSVGVGILLACALWDEGPKRLASRIRGVLDAPASRGYIRASFLLVLACVLSLLSAQFFPLRFGGRAPAVHWPADVFKLWYFLFPPVLAACWLRLGESQRALVLRSWIIAFGVISVIGVQQFFTGWPRAQANPLVPGYFHPVLFLGHHLSVASIWIFPFFAAVDILADRGLRARLRLPLVTMVVFLLCALFTLVAGYSRTLWVALPIGLIIWSLLRLRKKAAILAIGAMLVLGVAFASTSFVQRRIGSSMGIADRVQLWKANLDFFRHRPVLGVGFRKNQELSAYYLKWRHPERTDFFVGHAHDIFLEVLAGTGVIGLLAWLYWVAWVFGAITRVMRSRPRPPLDLSHAFLCAWIVLLINGVTQVNFWEGKVLHQLMWTAGLILFWRIAGQEGGRA